MQNRKSGRFIVAGLFMLSLAVFPFHGSEAQSAEMPLSELGCEKLNALRFDKMDAKQQAFASQCASDEAALAWEEWYDGLGETVPVAAVVYE